MCRVEPNPNPPLYAEFKDTKGFYFPSLSVNVVWQPEYKVSIFLPKFLQGNLWTFGQETLEFSTKQRTDILFGSPDSYSAWHTDKIHYQVTCLLCIAGEKKVYFGTEKLASKFPTIFKADTEESEQEFLKHGGKVLILKQQEALLFPSSTWHAVRNMGTTWTLALGMEFLPHGNLVQFAKWVAANELDKNEEAVPKEASEFKKDCKFLIFLHVFNVS